jgi:hypothetical protein
MILSHFIFISFLIFFIFLFYISRLILRIFIIIYITLHFILKDTAIGLVHKYEQEDMNHMRDLVLARMAIHFSKTESISRQIPSEVITEGNISSCNKEEEKSAVEKSEGSDDASSLKLQIVDLQRQLDDAKRQIEILEKKTQEKKSFFDMLLE